MAIGRKIQLDRQWLIGGLAATVLLAVAWVLLVPAADWLARQDVGSVVA
jgi:hypothetical protein